VQKLREFQQLSNRFISHVGIDAELVKKFRALAGHLPIADRDTLRTVTVEDTSSVPHIDCYMDKQTNLVAELMGPNNCVAFLWTEDNEDGHFRYGDVTVPIWAGTFVTFRGDIPHYTMLKSGTALMLGPFEVSTPHPIGSIAHDTCTEDFSVCGEDEEECECSSRNGKGDVRMLALLKEREEHVEAHNNNAHGHKDANEAPPVDKKVAEKNLRRRAKSTKACKEGEVGLCITKVSKSKNNPV